METLALHTIEPTVYWEYNTRCISVVEAKRVTPIVKQIDIPVCFLQEQYTMVFLFQNMRSLVSCRQICAPDHVQFKKLVKVINGRLDSDYI